MGKPETAAIVALMLVSQISASQMLAQDTASPFEMAQAETKTPPAAPGGPPTTVAPAEKSALSIPALGVGLERCVPRARTPGPGACSA